MDTNVNDSNVSCFHKNNLIKNKFSRSSPLKLSEESAIKSDEHEIRSNTSKAGCLLGYCQNSLSSSHTSGIISSKNKNTLGRVHALMRKPRSAQNRVCWFYHTPPSSGVIVTGPSPFVNAKVNSTQTNYSCDLNEDMKETNQVKLREKKQLVKPHTIIETTEKQTV
ncbi:unnamed protein product [Heterobilharzia americana]|nr:unnamed protein product [Heterobilharzia americana]CAH8458452.1 unnamed protein product [Heterobilharzia americana]